MPFVIAGFVLLALDPVTVPVALVAFAHGWIIPELYAFRGASVLRLRDLYVCVKFPSTSLFR